MRNLLLILLLITGTQLFAQLTYEDLIQAVDKGSDAGEIKEMIREQGIVFEINRDLLKQMTKEKRPDWLIDLLMDYDQPVYVAEEREERYPSTQLEYWRWHRPYAGYGFWPSVYWHRYGAYDYAYPYRFGYYYPFLGYSFYNSLAWYDPFGYYSPYGYYYPRNIYYGSNIVTRARLTPNGIIIRDDYNTDRNAVRRGSTSTQRLPSSTVSPRASSRSSATSSAPTSSRTRVSAPTSSRSNSSSSTKAVRRKQ